MQLTRFTDYTLRVLISVAVSDRGVTIGAISAQYGISRNHLMKVVQHLGHLGYLETVRGKGGGLRLAVPASEIRLGDVVRDVEGGFDIVPCFDKTRPDICVIAPACVLKGVLRGALSAFLDVLDGYTLEDLIGPKRPLRSLLALKVQGARPPRRARAVRAQA